MSHRDNFGLTHPEIFVRNAVEYGKVVSLELVVKDKLVRNDADLVAQLAPSHGQRMNVQRARLGLSTRNPELVHKGLLLLWCDLRVAEEDYSAFRSAC